MEERPDASSVEHHVREIAGRTDADAAELASRLTGPTWPGGVVDRSERAALAWLRRWRPTKRGVLPLACGCASGRCLVCN